MNLSYIDTRYAAFFRFVRSVIVCLFLFSCPVSAGISLHMADNIDLSNNAILDMYQDENGYMWIGTYDGLNLYNGKNTYVFRFEPNNKNTLCSNIINKIVYGGDGYLWVSTSMGLNRFSLKDRKVTESYTEYPECLNVASDSVGNTLVIKQKDFISCYSPEAGSFQDVHVQGMNEEVAKVLFAGGERQFFILDADGSLLEICPDFESFPLSLDIKKTPVHEKKIDRAYYLDGILYYVDMENRFYSYRMKDRKKEYLADLTGWMDKYGKLSRIALFHSDPYLVFRNGLLLNIGNPEEEALGFDVGLFCVLPDRKQDILWVGTDGQGVRMYYDKYNRFSGIQLKNLPIVMRNPVRSIYTENEKTIWFGTKGNGFVRVEDYDSYEKGEIPAGKVKHFTTSDGLSSDRVYCFRKSNYYPWVWIGTEGPGLSYYSLVDKKVYTLASLVDTKIRYVHAIREVNDSTLWMATTGDGLLEVVIGKKDGEPVIKYVESFILEKNGKVCNEFHSMNYDDEASLLYLGSRGGYGLVRFNLLTKKYEFIPMNNAGNRAVGDVLCMCYSRDSTFYLGASSGMTQMKLHSGTPAEVRQYSRIDGIKNDMVHGILEDPDGCIWLSTNKGLAKYNPHNHFFHNYGSPDLDVTEFSDDAYWKCPYTGKLFFGGINGLIWVDPQNDRQENYKPALHFFELKMGNETHSLYDYTDQKTGYVTIPPNISTFSISFVATDYIHGENYEYSYLLENYNTSWAELQKDNEVAFTKLPYGNYVLKVRYKNDVFDSDAKEYFLHIRVLPPWYRGSWAMIAYGLVLATICLGIVYWLRRRIVEKQAEVARKIREEQKEKLYEAKLNFFANITHELCTPLTLINGVNDYIKISADRLADGKLEKYARILGENVTNLNELIQEILDIRKIEEVGFSHIQIKRVSVSSLIRKQCESFIPVAEQNGINFTFSDVDKPVYWNTDVPSLKKIIRNLVSNAFKYTEQKGTIDVSVRIENESLIIKVYNTGKGIAEADLKTIFDRFHILGDLDGNNYTQMTSRNGLGLFICHSMVQLLRGEINVESKEGESAGFIVTLPYLEVEEMDLDEQADEEVPVAQPVVSAVAAETTGNIGNPVILVVDDNRDIVWLIKETLSSEYAVREAFNAEEALALMDQQTPDLIITDIMMPSMDGFALISRIKSDKFTRHIPLIVVSAKVSESEQAEGLDLGADVYLTKPFSSVVLHSVVNRLMANKKELKDYYYSPESAYEQSGGQLIHQEDKEFMDSVTAIIKENLAQDTLRPELIADKLGMNTRALYRRFKKISPLTPSDFIKDYRMMHAARLLVTTNLSVQEIIYQVGISNKSYFYREFSAKYGVTPGEYRRMQ